MNIREPLYDLTALNTLSFHELSTLACADVLILTATNRLAISIKNSFLEKVDNVSVLPTITPYKAWLQELSNTLPFKCLTMPLVLNETAQRYYWKQAIAKELQQAKILNRSDRYHVAKKPVFLNISSAASLMSQAARLQAEWDIDVLQHEINDEYTFFLACQQHYQQSIHTMWDSPELGKQILQAIREGKFAIPKYIVLDGFYSLSPYQQLVLNAFQEQGANIYRWNGENTQAKTIQLFSAESEQQELQAALQWAVQSLQSSSQSNPLRMAIVVPNLQEISTTVQRLATRYFQNTALENKWHIAVGRPLFDWVLVRSVLQWLTLMASFLRGKVSVAEVGSALLNSEFLFSQEQQYALGQWDVCLRQGKATHIGSVDFLNGLESISPQIRQVFQSLLTHWQGKKTCAEWAESYRDVLVSLPKVRSLNSLNYQVVKAFEKAIHAFSMLDEMLPAIEAQEALEIVESELKETTFQRQRGKDVMVDIIGLYETEGGRWDNVWVMGLNDNVLPKAPSPNPYLPISSQRRKRVLHATSESEQEWSLTIFNAILQSSATLVLSWQMYRQDEKCRPSSFLKKYLASAKPLPITTPVSSDNIALDYIDDAQGLSKTGNVQGGYGIIEKYSRNPLWGYAVLRLHLAALEHYPQQTLSTMVKGNFFHHAMEKFYSQLHGQEELYDDKRVEEELSKALLEAAKEELSCVGSTVLKELTIKRAGDIIRSFIEVEKNNRDFFSIECVEKKYGYAINGLIFNFKVDRVDRLSNNRLVFIDYKTGHVDKNKNVKNWLEDRQLKHIQLPLYAVLFSDDPTQVAGISFVELGRKEGYYLGMWNRNQPVGDDTQLVLDASAWKDAVAQWQGKLTKIFTEIERGDAHNRVEQLDDINYCDVIPFLRFFDEEKGGADE